MLLLLVENANQKYGWVNCVPMYIILRFLHLVSVAVCALCLEKNISFPKDKLSSYLSGGIASGLVVNFNNLPVITQSFLNATLMCLCVRICFALRTV